MLIKSVISGICLVALVVGAVELFGARSASGKGGDPKSDVSNEEVLGILARRCNSCHSEGEYLFKDETRPSANFNMETYAGLMALYKSKRFVVPGDPVHSPLLQVVREGHGTGRYGRTTPLPVEEIEAVSGWIASGAKDYRSKAEAPSVTFRDVPFDRDDFGNVEIEYRVPAEAEIIVTVQSLDGKILQVGRSSQNWTPSGWERAPGDLSSISILPDKNWPTTGNVIVQIKHATESIVGSKVYYTTQNTGYYEYLDLFDVSCAVDDKGGAVFSPVYWTSSVGQRSIEFNAFEQGGGRNILSYTQSGTPIGRYTPDLKAAAFSGNSNILAILRQNERFTTVNNIELKGVTIMAKFISNNECGAGSKVGL